MNVGWRKESLVDYFPNVLEESSLIAEEKLFVEFVDKDPGFDKGIF